MRSAPVTLTRNITIPLIRGDYTPMQAKAQKFRPTHLWKAPYGILEPMVFEVFMNSAKTFVIVRDRHGQLRECATKCLIPYEPVLEDKTYDLQDNTYRTLTDQLQGSPTSRTDTTTAVVSRQVSYLSTSATTNANIVTPSLTVAWSSLAPFTMTNSAGTLSQQRQVSFLQM